MIQRESLSQPVVRGALIALVICALLAIWTLGRALSKPASIEAAVALGTGPVVQAVPLRAPSSIGSAIEGDPFSPLREAPTQPYRLPGEDAPAAALPREEPPVPAVLGIALMGPGHDFTTLQLPGGIPIIARVGDKVGDYMIKSIDRGHVVFVRGGKTLDVPALKSGA